MSAGRPLPHESAPLHVSGEARFVDDRPEIEGMLHLAIGGSPCAHGRLRSLDLEAVRAAPGVEAVLTARDIPARNQCGPILEDDPILAEDELLFMGQPLFAVVASSQRLARQAVRKARIEVDPLPLRLDARAAFEAGDFVLPPQRLTRGDAGEGLKSAAIRRRGRFRVGGQEHFYLEGQVAVAAPDEEGGLEVWCSTQHPSEMQHLIAGALGRDAAQIRVEMRRMGGGFGGKESQSAQVACLAAIAADRLQRPVKCRLDRDDDMRLTGKRHGVEYDYEIGCDETGRIQALKLRMLFDAGCSADLSGPVATRALCHADNAYFLPSVDLEAHSCRTHKVSNTAFRGFGGPQGAFAVEYLLDDLARELGMDALDLRRRNFYSDPEQTTPYGQPVEEVLIHPLVDELEQSSDYRRRREEIERFNRNSPVIRKGLALTPVKFGISFNVVHFNQAGALVHVYTDGSIRVNHGGTEMGQGLHTKVAQLVAGELGVGLERLRVTATDTAKIPNTSATAASTGADLNGMAALEAARTIRKRLADFIAAQEGLDADSLRFAEGRVRGEGFDAAFEEVVRRAYAHRVQLWSDGFYATPELHWDRERLQGRPFYYFAWGAAVSEVAIDSLTGEYRILRADLLHDAGQSLNPAIDRGQIEGGFVQGVGWLTREELRWDERGELLTHAPSTYKIPSVSDCPADFRVSLFDRPNHKPTVMRSKAVGEPPLLLGFSVFFALRDAIASIGQGRVHPPLDAPATPEAVLRAVEACRSQA